MDEDDLPPGPAEGSDDRTFSGQLGQTFAGAVWIGLFLLIAGAVLYAAMHWL